MATITLSDYNGSGFSLNKLWLSYGIDIETGKYIGSAGTYLAKSSPTEDGTNYRKYTASWETGTPGGFSNIQDHVFTGSGMRISSDDQDQPVSGWIKGAELFSSGQSVIKFEGLDTDWANPNSTEDIFKKVYIPNITLLLSQLDGALVGGDDKIYATEGPDKFFSGNGRDYISLKGGNDYFDGGIGDDTAYGGRGEDRIRGREGDDLIKGGRGRDTLEGNQDNDVIFGHWGNDFLRGGKGADTLYGFTKNDRETDDSGTTDNDILVGGFGNDTLSGGHGNDKIGGGKDNDELKGGFGDDWLIGGFNDDFLWGDSGNDTYIYSIGHNHGIDYVDFELGKDKIYLEPGIDYEFTVIDEHSAIRLSGSNTSGTIKMLLTNVAFVDGDITRSTNLPPESSAGNSGNPIN